jgi:mRNA-degrading endonuclease RelE of RelBE toxin-antitoxin system
MVIIETSVFTRRVQKLLTEDEYRQFQNDIASQPTKGTLIPQSSGLRKVRWGQAGKGKRGGVRIIYYWARSQEQLLMLYIYPKSERDDLTPVQLKILSAIVEEQYP